MLIVSFALTALGFCIAWRMSSTQGFHAIMNLFLMPMWLLSGALFPASGAVGGLKWVILANPLTYGLAALRRALYWTNNAAVAALPSMAVSLMVTALFAATMFALASIIARGRVAGDLQ
jgi:ABC-type polysaccharide/polyol phosphate export permease